MRPIPDFGLEQELMVPEMEPCLRLCADSSEPTWDSLSLSLCLSLPLPPSLTPPPQINKHL